MWSNSTNRMCITFYHFYRTIKSASILIQENAYDNTFFYFLAEQTLHSKWRKLEMFM